MRYSASKTIRIGTLAMAFGLAGPQWATGEEAPAADQVSPEVILEVPAPPSLADTPELQLSPQADFVYRLVGRPDPFMPFVEAAPAPSPDVDVAEREEEVLTGLRRFEPGQLTLTAIIVSDRETMAMAEDSTGRGYFIRPGDLIGRQGRVESITPGRVIIKEPTVTPTGETEYRTIEMFLTQEGD
ncbi:hypothetical protein [Desulfurivibrio alkaliphilus]|uniref:Pilus assembly protein PilP n=1 Tax=Desulfurivibrio alkaliphilus (strain DSM 19089 / UNIQEM U267 / AHT2) TaxID=589865 RepID=D6Z6Y8_DESAT|nr:hypothetical protein [Desulfurivibrio alkaliphilus]ADH86975.1 hypothetical protein DaAHT2_2310 [Desulfurivibrio alkaliphilus AHT 2]